jgi:hypothetical protein
MRRTLRPLSEDRQAISQTGICDKRYSTPNIALELGVHTLFSGRVHEQRRFSSAWVCQLLLQPCHGTCAAVLCDVIASRSMEASTFVTSIRSGTRLLTSAVSRLFCTQVRIDEHSIRFSSTSIGAE